MIVQFNVPAAYPLNASNARIDYCYVNGNLPEYIGLVKIIDNISTLLGLLSLVEFDGSTNLETAD